jgi:energy-coupling factor transporter ATP-binding protein EcfA2
VIGRETERARLLANVARGRHTLLVGPIGAGKTHLLRAVAAEVPEAVYVPHVQPLRLCLLGLAERLHARGQLVLATGDAAPETWPECARLLNRVTVRELTAVVVASLRARPTVLILDSLEAATPTMAPVLEACLEAAVVLGATRDCRPGLQKLWWAFERLDLPPLARDNAKALLWSVVDRARLPDAALFEATVLEQAAGNPHAIVEMARQVPADGPVDIQTIRALQHGAGLRFLDLTPALLLVAAGLVAARFVALGLDNRDLYILAGTLGALFFVVRVLLTRRSGG